MSADARQFSAGMELAGRTCPYCLTPIKPGVTVAECSACHSVQHAECYFENGGCPVPGCAGGPSAQGSTAAATAAYAPPQFSANWPPPVAVGSQTYPAQAVPPPGAGPPQREFIPPPPPSFSQPSGAGTGGSGRSMSWLVGGALALALLFAGVAVAILLSRHSKPPLATVSSVASAGAPVSSPVSAQSTDIPPPATPQPPSTAAPTTTAVPPGLRVNGQDANGYNTGSACSDDPSSPLPGCSDSPSVPNGDPEGSCPNGITVDAQTTTCGLAESVYSAYTGDGATTGISPKTSRSYTFNCQTAGTGTTGFTICQGHAGSSPLYVRWHK